MTIAGKRLHIAHDNRLELDAEYPSDAEVRWVATAGPPAGQSGVNTMHAREVAPGVHFLNWLEDNGTMVSQVIDFNVCRIDAFITFDPPDGRRSAWEHGAVRES